MAAEDPARDNDTETLYSKPPSDMAQDFLKEHGSSIHAIFDDLTKVTETDQQDRSTPIPPAQFNPTTQRQTEQFLEIMDSHQSASKDKAVGSTDLRAKHSWNDMIDAAERAKHLYEASGAKGVRKSGRRLSSGAALVQPYLRLIPNGFYTSIFYGALRLVFESFTQLDERRSKVLKSFLRVPNIIILAEGCVKNFPSDAILYEKAEEVFCAALPAIEGAVRWLKQNPASKQFRALILGPLYNKSFKEKLQCLDEALNDLQERVSILRDQSLRMTEETIYSVKNILNRSDTQMSIVAEDIKHISRSQDQTQAKVDDLQGQDLEYVREQAREAIRIVLEQNIMTSEWMRESGRALRRMKRRIEALEKVEAALTQADLLDILNVERNLGSRDLQHLQRVYHAAELDELAIIKSIIKGSRMGEWQHTDSASALFVEGVSSASFDRTTPLSLLCANVIQSFMNKGPAVPLYFFCGLHTSMSDPVQGPSGMIRSLISQVLQLCPLELDFVSRRYRLQLEALHLHTLCDCFCKLVRKLDVSTVLICVIDGISFFETKEWATDCQEVISHLQNLLEDDEVDPVFKLLVTSPARTRHVGNSFHSRCRMTVSASDPNNTRYEPTEREIAMMSRRPMRPNAQARPIAPSVRRRRHMLDIPTKATEKSRPEAHSDSSISEDEMLSEMNLDTKGADVADQLPPPH